MIGAAETKGVVQAYTECPSAAVVAESVALNLGVRKCGCFEIRLMKAFIL